MRKILKYVNIFFNMNLNSFPNCSIDNKAALGSCLNSTEISAEH